MDQLAALAEVADPAARARQASSLIEEHQAAIAELSHLRRAALDEMLSNGMTQTPTSHWSIPEA